MFLALKEMQRAKLRFGLLIAAIALLVFLILFQQSLQNGLLTSFVGAIRNQTAPVLVYAVDGQRVIQGSAITPDLETAVRGVEGVDSVGRIGQGTFTAAVSLTPGRTFDAALIGYDLSSGLGAPSTLVAGRLPVKASEAVGSAEGEVAFAVGDAVTLQPGGFTVEVVGIARDVQLSVTPTLFTAYDTWVAATRSVNPDAGEPLPNILAVAPVEGTTARQVVDAVNSVSDDLDALTREDAAAKTPGVAQVQQSFRLIFFLYGLVVPCVTGLFFLIVTFQKAGALTLLRAIGAPRHKLVSSLLAQVLIIVAAGLAIGTLLYYPLAQRQLGGIQLRFETAAVGFWAALLTVLGLASALVAARRVLRIDPIEATTGAGLGR